MKEAIKEILLNEFVETDDPSDLSNDTPLVSSGILDSISILQLVDQIEKSFNIQFEAHEIDKEGFDSIDKIADKIASKQK